MTYFIPVFPEGAREVRKKIEKPHFMSVFSPELISDRLSPHRLLLTMAGSKPHRLLTMQRMPRAERNEEREAIYCNGISYMYFLSPDYYVEKAAFSERERGGEADSVSQQAACQRGEKKRQTSGNGWEWRRSRRGGEKICL